VCVSLWRNGGRQAGRQAGNAETTSWDHRGALTACALPCPLLSCPALPYPDLSCLWALHTHANHTHTHPYPPDPAQAEAGDQARAGEPHGHHAGGPGPADVRQELLPGVAPHLLRRAPRHARLHARHGTDGRMFVRALCLCCWSGLANLGLAGGCVGVDGWMDGWMDGWVGAALAAAPPCPWSWDITPIPWSQQANKQASKTHSWLTPPSPPC
jgi:hypothetical protein